MRTHGGVLKFHVIRGPAWKWIPGIFTDTFMLSPTAPVFGNLASATSRALAGLQRSVGRTLGGQASAQALAEGDGGKHTFATRLGSLSRIKQIELKNVQGAVTYLELQDSGL